MAHNKAHGREELFERKRSSNPDVRAGVRVRWRVRTPDEANGIRSGRMVALAGGTKRVNSAGRGVPSVTRGNRAENIAPRFDGRRTRVVNYPSAGAALAALSE